MACSRMSCFRIVSSLTLLMYLASAGDYVLAQEFDEVMRQCKLAACVDDSYGDCCDDDCCGDCCGCGDPVQCGSCGPCRPRVSFYSGFEATFVKPHYEENAAFTVMESDGATFESLTDTEFDYDLDFAPRVYFGWQHCDGVGLRATWWQYDHAADTVSANPPANGFGSVTHPPFGDVDISTVIPTDTFSATSDLDAYTFDLEATKHTSFCSWDFGVGCGVRYANAEQSYFAQTIDTNNVLRGQIDYNQRIEGFGPTISIDAYRPFGCQSGIFCRARGSILFGDGESNLTAIEDADLTAPFNTSRVTNRDDLLSIGEIQLGYKWRSRRALGRRFMPFLSVAMEGQLWNGAGTATSEDGTLGFFGLAAGAGVNW